jgi:hypothetical protein
LIGVVAEAVWLEGGVGVVYSNMLGAAEHEPLLIAFEFTLSRGRNGARTTEKGGFHYLGDYVFPQSGLLRR